MTPKKKIPSVSQLPEGAESSYHQPVLLKEALDGLRIRSDGIYVDCTFGGGGHSKAILGLLGEKGRLLAFDQDEDARSNLPNHPGVTFIPHNFRHIARFLRLEGLEKVDGILADLGVSSHQFDKAERGFSTRFNADLDMRMDRRQPKTAFDVVQQYREPELHRIFEQYGEVTNSKTLAKTIIEVRNQVSLRTVDGFKQALRAIVKGNPHKYFAQVFQALRIEVNDEMGALKALLEQSPGLLNTGGRLAIITFHSIEDRLVKNYFRKGTNEETEVNPFLNVGPETPWKLVNKKPIVPGDEELKSNPRSRSAKLRIAERKAESPRSN
jgi:16S rRNA (cytosine1402-N4)-methyltransferase